MTLAANVSIEFYCGEQLLEPGLTLSEIVTTLWAEEPSDLVLHYRIG